MSERHAVKDGRHDLPFMVHSELDDLGLDPYEFRVYAHLVRRTGGVNGEYYASVDTGAAHCRMDVKTYRAALNALVALRLVTRTDRPGQTSKYRLTPKSEWLATPAESGRATTSGRGTKSGSPTRSGRGTPTKNGRTPLPETVAKGNPLKGIPLRESQETRAREKTPSQKFNPLDVDLPPHVDPTTWADFVGHRTEIRKRLTRRAVQLILADLAKTPHDANEMLKRTIANGWTGVFPLDKPTRRAAGTPEERAAERATDLLAHLERRKPT